MLVKIPLSSKVRLLLPAIVQHKQGWHGVVTQTDDQGIRVLSFQHKKGIHYSYDQFQKAFMPDIILMEKLPNNTYEKPKLSLQLRVSENLFQVGLGILLVLIVLGLFFHKISLYHLILLDGIGVLISGLAFIVDHNYHNSMYDKICQFNTPSNKSGCENADIEIPVLGWKFSTLGLIYFSINLVLLLSLPQVLPLTYWMFLPLGVVFIMYSIYKQFFILKHFCNICIIIISVFLLKLIYIVFLSSMDFVVLFTILQNVEWVLYILVIALILLSSSYISTKNEIHSIKNTQSNIWSEHQVIEKFVIKDDVLFSQCCNNIVLGTPNATVIIDLIIHISCKHCQAALNSVIHLMMLNENIQLRLYIHHYERPTDHQMLAHCIEAIRRESYFEVLKIFASWKAGLTAKYSVVITSEKIKEILDTNKQFFVESHIEHYPIILINGSRIPGFVPFEDIKIAYSHF